ncbi:sugar phosphate isomerase/epimerase family protein [Alteromonas confluentis]|uniref:Xylose isomerase-like TIM barrel domain-containing protein n=1 Tax=Alteromonas confluentis TaxID=1656094 RepID=A0A1E7Z622_9ALTE|nr:TIM barrel protein [Alteromonas confluentis]OFC68950.1 hypothetical protein BFC18_19595 [Alteromonas confluentis]
MNGQIYISSSCVNNRKIADSVRQLAEQGYTNIELSGGTNLYPNWKQELMNLQSEFGIQYRCHNYFPPPEEHFVLNLSASDIDVRARSIAHVQQAITLSAELGAKEYGVHAGFRFMPDHKKLGQAFDCAQLQSEDEAIALFADAWEALNKQAQDHGVSLYVENNVLSKANRTTFGSDNPFLATDSASIARLQDACQASLLLDVAHLKVSCNSLGLSFETELAQLVRLSDYLHFSDNDGTADTNHGVREGTALFSLLRKVELANKTITLEVYDGSIQTSLNATLALLQPGMADG